MVVVGVVDGFTFSLDSVAPVRREVGVGEVGDHSLGVVQQRRRWRRASARSACGRGRGPRGRRHRRGGPRRGRRRRRRRGSDQRSSCAPRRPLYLLDGDVVLLRALEERPHIIAVSRDGATKNPADGGVRQVSDGCLSDSHGSDSTGAHVRLACRRRTGRRCARIPSSHRAPGRRPILFRYAPAALRMGRARPLSTLRVTTLPGRRRTSVMASGSEEVSTWSPASISVRGSGIVIGSVCRGRGRRCARLTREVHLDDAHPDDGRVLGNVHRRDGRAARPGRR